MGCADSKQSNLISELKSECHKLMHENLEYLTVIEYVLIEKSKLSLSLRVISIHKRTEEFYEIITKSRNFWIANAKKALESSTSNQVVLECLKEQSTEKSQLEKARDEFAKIISHYKPSWQDRYETISLLKETLESKPMVIQQSTKLYGNFYSENIKTIKLGSAEYSPDAEGFDLEVYQLLRSVTVAFYKTPETRVYYTPEIEHKKQEKKELLMAQLHEEIIVSNNTELVNNLKSFEEPVDLHGDESIEIKEDKSIEKKVDESINDYSEYEESESEDPNFTQRLSYTQK